MTSALCVKFLSLFLFISQEVVSYAHMQDSSLKNIDLDLKIVALTLGNLETNIINFDAGILKCCYKLELAYSNQAVTMNEYVVPA